MKTWIYWVSTSLFSLAMLGSALAHLSQAPQIREGFAALGYPAYFMLILGTWKLLGVLALIAPKLPRLKEWAYAGFLFNLTAATVSHLAIGDGAGKVMPPLVLLGVWAASFATRPAARAWPVTRESLPASAPSGMALPKAA